MSKSSYSKFSKTYKVKTSNPITGKEVYQSPRKQPFLFLLYDFIVEVSIVLIYYLYMGSKTVPHPKRTLKKRNTPSIVKNAQLVFFFYGLIERIVRSGPSILLPKGPETRRYLSDYQGGPVSGPPLAVVKRNTGPILFIVLYSFIFHAKNHIYCMLTFFIQGSILIYNVFFFLRQCITWSSVYMKHLIAIKHFK